ncbi:MAG: hypothetical protein F4045_03200 [Chloroflexi bacterium]|nr:hypothetical protein [Chloroflexota bacterium]MYK34130.1 hypothetical protein [Chloroflexota bacterium]
MAAQAVLIAVLIVVAAAAAVPFVWLERTRTRRRRDANVLVLGGAVLGGGQGAIAFGVFTAATADLATPWLLLLPLLSVAAALLALWAAFRREGMERRALLLVAAALSLGGASAGALFVLTGVASFVAALCYLAGLSDNPRDLLRRLDPRD